MAYTSNLVWQGDGYRFDATSGTGVAVTIGKDAADDRVGPGPKELVCMALGSCAGTNFVSLMKKMRQDLSKVEINVEAQVAEVDPMVFTHVLTTYKIWGKSVDGAKVKKALDYIEEKYCGVLHMVNKTAKTEYAFEITEG
jgi:putative redox protein